MRGPFHDVVPRRNLGPFRFKAILHQKRFGFARPGERHTPKKIATIAKTLPRYLLSPIFPSSKCSLSPGRMAKVETVRHHPPPAPDSRPAAEKCIPLAGISMHER